MKTIFLMMLAFLIGCSAPAPTATPVPTATSIPTPTSVPTATPTIQPLTAQNVVDKFIEAGLEISNIHPGERVEGSPLPTSYNEQLEFAVAEVEPKGGQVFVCATKPDCDKLYIYFDALKGFGGPYYYQSPDGRVVAQLNSGLSPETGEKFKEVVDSLP